MSSRARTRPRASVLLVREWETQMSSSGCCGRLEGDFLQRGGERCFPERRAAMEAMGPLYRDLRARYGTEVDINVLDPRSLVSLFALLFRDFWVHRVGARAALTTLFRLPVKGVVVNGRLITRGVWPELADVEAALGDTVGPRVAARREEEVVRGLA